LVIDRSQFYPIFDKNFIILHHTQHRQINKTDFNRYVKNIQEGIRSIRNIEYEIKEDLGFININHFVTEYNENMTTAKNYDLRQGPVPFKPKNKRAGSMNMVF
jgi:hypothetical protein